MSRLVMLVLTIALVAAAGCEPSTAPVDDCSTAPTLDCPPVNFRDYVLTVQVISGGGTAVSGAAVRVEAPNGCCAGIFWNQTTDAAGQAVFTLIQRRPPWPLNIRVTPPLGSPFSAAAVSDTIVWQDVVAYRIVPIVLPLSSGQ